jgi:hypothetical protein
MAAFVLFVLAVAGGMVVADLVWENPTAGQVTAFGQTVGGYPEGWLLATAAGLGFVAALLLVASVNSTKGRRARRKQLRGLRRGLEDQVVAPESDHARLLDAFFGPEQPSRHLGGPARPADPRGEGPESRADDHQGWVTAWPIQHPTEPLYQQVRSAQVREDGWEGRAEHDRHWGTGRVSPRAALRAGPPGRWAGPGLGPPGRGQPGAPAVTVPVEVRGGREQQPHVVRDGARACFSDRLWVGRVWRAAR